MSQYIRQKKDMIGGLIRHLGMIGSGLPTLSRRKGFYGYYPPQTKVWDKVMFLRLCVSVSFCSQVRGVGFPACITRHVTEECASRGVCLWGYTSGGGVYIQGRVGQTPLRYYGIWSISGRYAPFWNAFLLNNLLRQWLCAGSCQHHIQI